MKHSIENIKSKITEIKQNSNRTITNFYTNLTDEKNIIDVCDKENSIVFCIDDNSIHRLYFYSSDEKELADVLSGFSKGCSIDYIAKLSDSSKDILFENAGYYKHAVFKRASNPALSENMKKNIPSSLLKLNVNNYCSFAEKEHAALIHNKLYEIFDPYTSHIESICEIEKMIEQNQITVNIKDDNIIALCAYRFEGKKIYMNHLYNCGRAEISFAMYIKALQTAVDNNINYAYTWVNEKNNPIISFIYRFGFAFDGLIDNIYIKK